MVAKNVNLELMEEPEFRALCAEMFNELGYGAVEKCEAKKGKDFIVHSTDGKIFAECKFKPRSSVGRAVIQSLHSEMTAKGAIKGIVVTTGGFTDDVIQYVADYQLPIELIDGNRFVDLLAKAGYDGGDEGPGPRILTFRLPDKKEIDGKLAAYLDGKVRSFPKALKELVDARDVKASMIPAFVSSYSVDATFSTSAGRIHQERANGRILINGNTGKNLGWGIADCVSRSPPDALTPFSELAGMVQNKEQPCFTLPVNHVKDAMINAIIERHTRNVTYYGKNNQKYTKACVPNRNQIQIQDLSQFYLPELKADMNLFGRKHQATFIDAGCPDVLVLESSASKCAVCKKEFAKKGILCNECGIAVCEKKGFFGPKGHGSTCSQCGESVCLSCGKVRRRMLIMKTVLCPRCAERLAKK